MTKYNREGMSSLPEGREVNNPEAYEKGEEARSLGKRDDWNPYDYPSDDYNDWANGWSDEDKRGY